METSDIYAVLMERLKYSNSKHLRGILQKLVTPVEGQLLLELPAEPAVLAQKSGLDEQTVQTKLQELVEKGLIIKSSKGLRFVRDVTQLHDANLSSSDKWVDSELLDMWKEFYEGEWFDTMKTIPTDAYVQYVRVVPAWKAIERSPSISLQELRFEENLKELVRSAEVIAVVPCTCRRSMRRCKAVVENCIQFNRGAEYAIGRGAGRRVSAEEAMSIFGQAEEAGLVHTWPFAVAGSPRLNEVCNCCIDCCAIFDAGFKFGTIGRILEKSHLRAEVDQDSCTGCQDCVERCFFNDIEMKKYPSAKKLKASVDREKCFGCGVCVLACAPDAITMKLVK